MTVADLRVDAVIVACAVSAGIHGALVPEHFADGPGPGVGFVAATVLLAAAAVGLTYRPSRTALRATALLFAELIVAYAAAATVGVPLLHPEPEPVDGLALVTKAVEAMGLVFSAGLAVPRPAAAVFRPKGTLT